MKNKEARREKRAAAPRREIKIDYARFPRRMLELLIISFFVTLLVEGFNQSTVPRMIAYLGQRTVYFCLNWLIVFTSLCLSELVRRRRAMTVLISSIWLILGFVNFMVSHNRTLPLSGGDLILTYEVASLITVYFTWFEIIAMFGGAALLIAAIVAMFTCTARREHINYAAGIGLMVTLVLGIFFGHMLAIQGGLMPETFPDRVNSYREYGFTTCFTFTFGERGIDKPDKYSTETVEEIMEEIAEEPQPTVAPVLQRFTTEAMEQPNIVFLQLESFFDLDTMVDTQLSGDPMPYFHELMENWPTGTLYVPTVGGGTANVEFEVMSGLNMDFFGSGETPYSTIIQQVTCETIAHNLRGHGYTSTALHNNTGTFFTRNQVYANLGFDRFDCLETMLDPKYNRVGWAHDTILTGEILRAMENSAGQDLIFAISVESHGKYGETYESQPGNIEVLSAPEEIYLAPFQNYVNIIPQVDGFIKELIAELEAYDEPVVAVIYGDHLPGVGLTPQMVQGGDFYASKYVIWNNFGADFEAPDMQAYRLSAELLRQLGISDGVMTKFHQSYPVSEDGEEYLEKLKILEYDLLYGDQSAYGEAGAPAATDLQIGIDPVIVESVTLEYGRLLVTGENFTQFSWIAAGEELLEAVYLDRNHIALSIPDDEAAEFPATIAVAQATADGKELCRTGEVQVVKLRGHQ